MASGERVGEHLGIEIAWGKELKVDANGGLWRKIAVGILGCQDGILFYRSEVTAKEEGGDGTRVLVLAEARQDGSLAEVRVCVDEAVCHGRAEGVPDVNELVELCVDAVDRAVAEEEGKFLKSGNFEGFLDLVDRIALGRGGDAETVPGEG